MQGDEYLISMLALPPRGKLINAWWLYIRIESNLSSALRVVLHLYGYVIHRF